MGWSSTPCCWFFMTHIIPFLSFLCKIPFMNCCREKIEQLQKIFYCLVIPFNPLYFRHVNWFFSFQITPLWFSSSKSAPDFTSVPTIVVIMLCNNRNYFAICIRVQGLEGLIEFSSYWKMKFPTNVYTSDQNISKRKCMGVWPYQWKGVPNIL